MAKRPGSRVRDPIRGGGFFADAYSPGRPATPWPARARFDSAPQRNGSRFDSAPRRTAIAEPAS